MIAVNIRTLSHALREAKEVEADQLRRVVVKLIKIEVELLHHMVR